MIFDTAILAQKGPGDFIEVVVMLVMAIMIGLGQVLKKKKQKEGEEDEQIIIAPPLEEIEWEPDSELADAPPAAPPQAAPPQAAPPQAAPPQAAPPQASPPPAAPSAPLARPPGRAHGVQPLAQPAQRQPQRPAEPSRARPAQPVQVRQRQKPQRRQLEPVTTHVELLADPRLAEAARRRKTLAESARRDAAAAAAESKTKSSRLTIDLNPRTLRQVVVLSEIFQPPIALREHHLA